MQKVEILVISISNPLLIGIYSDKILIEQVSSEGKTSDILPRIFLQISQKYHIDSLYYVSGPGSYMSIKVSYIFLKTISLINNIKLFGVSGFELNDNSPIKAIGKKYFIQKNEEIILGDLDNASIKDFQLPYNLQKLKISLDNLPNYILPAV